eukprot:gene15841-17437_t
MSGTSCIDIDEALLCNFKVALATVIIRSKPKTLSGKEYATILARKIAKIETTWRQKAEQLEKKLLELKQQNVHLRLKYETQIDEGAEFNKNKFNAAFGDQAIATAIRSTRRDEQIHENVEFMKILVALKWHKMSCELRSRIDDENVAKETVMKCIQTMSNSIGKLEWNGSSLDTLEESSGILIEILASDVFVDDLAIQDKLLKLVEEIIRAIMNQKSEKNEHGRRERLSKLATIFSSVPSIVVESVGKMASLVKAYSQVLQDHQKTRTMIQTDKFENICFVFRTMEQVLRRSDAAVLVNAAKTIFELLVSKDVFELSNTFPLFVHYTWKIKAIMETTVHDVTAKSSKNNSLWNGQQRTT